MLILLSIAKFEVEEERYLCPEGIMFLFKHEHDWLQSISILIIFLAPRIPDFSNV